MQERVGYIEKSLFYAYSVDCTLFSTEEHSYDAWGNMRNYTTWSYDNVNTDFVVNMGFTGHEMLPEFGLINMNGRMYDPVIGRMLSPDNYVQSPLNAQNYNRYSYCLNNPLKYTDPSGEFIQYIIGAVVGGVNGYMMADATGHKGWNKFWYTLGGAAIGAATAGIGTAVSSSAGVVVGGIAGGAFSGSSYGVMGAHAGGVRGGELFGAGFGGMWKGALTGLVGSSIGGAIGGGWGAFAGGASAGGFGALLNGASGKDILKGAVLGGALDLHYSFNIVRFIGG
ncbi:RHS repeat-associated core domain-containing protein [Bacteroidales bacterium OttesenSCG-928-I21]|nr:RHS repeat-associated core domain-containing protein [Bacteroidales bacterium OttesenSCG-928-I21]